MRLKTFSLTLEFSNSNPRYRWAPAETSSEDVFSAKAFTAKSMVFEHAIYGGFVCRLAWIFDDLTDSIINSRPWKTPHKSQVQTTPVIADFLLPSALVLRKPKKQPIVLTNQMFVVCTLRKK